MGNGHRFNVGYGKDKQGRGGENKEALVWVPFGVDKTV